MKIPCIVSEMHKNKPTQLSKCCNIMTQIKKFDYEISHHRCAKKSHNKLGAFIFYANTSLMSTNLSHFRFISANLISGNGRGRQQMPDPSRPS